MIGGSTDMVIEPNIVRAIGARKRVRASAPAPPPLDEVSNSRVIPSVVASPPPEVTPMRPSQIGRLSELAQQLNDALHRSSAAVEQPLDPRTKVGPAEAAGNLEDDLAMLIGRPR